MQSVRFGTISFCLLTLAHLCQLHSGDFELVLALLVRASTCGNVQCCTQMCIGCRSHVSDWTQSYSFRRHQDPNPTSSPHVLEQGFGGREQVGGGRRVGASLDPMAPLVLHSGTVCHLKATKSSLALTKLPQSTSDLPQVEVSIPFPAHCF